jgi:predicted ABC-type exoprotein transport system permease subunit
MRRAISPFFRLYRWLHYVLLEERDDVYAPNRKQRRQIHNCHLIQACAVLADIFSFAMIPIFFTLITIPYVALTCVVLLLATGVIWAVASFKVKQLNREDITRIASSSRDLAEKAVSQ